MKRRTLPLLAGFLFLAIALVPFGRPAQAQQAPAYIALGDSLAFGVGADTPATGGYVGLTAASLRISEAYNSTGLDLVNLSVPGARSGDLLVAGGQVDRAVDEINRRGGASIISIDVGANDLLALADPGTVCLQAPGSTACQTALGAMLGTLQTNLRTMLLRLRTSAPNAQIFVLDLYNPFSGSNGPEELVASVGVQQVNGVIAAAAADPALAVKFVSVHDLFEGRAKQWIASDGLHPNDAGYRVMSEVLLAAIQNRAIVIPSDLATIPTPAPVAAASGDSGVDALIPELGIPAAFAAGLVLSAAYFVVRGRR